MKMRNLLLETLDALQRAGYTGDDVQYVTDGEHEIKWSDFEMIAKGIDYDAGYGSTNVNTDLCVVGDEAEAWWLEREEYDGSEWWVFKKFPTQKHDGYDDPKLFWV